MPGILGGALIGIVESRLPEHEEVALPPLFDVLGMEETLDIRHTLISAEQVLKKVNQ